MQAKKTVLLVDSNPDHRKRIVEALADNSEIKIIQTATLAEAQIEINHDFPDLVLIELILPDGNSIDFIPDDFDQVLFPFVVMTNKGDEQDVVDAMKAGAVDYIVKSNRAFKELNKTLKRVWREWAHIVNQRELNRKIQNLAQNIMDVQEQERSNIAKEIHDDFGSSLSVLKMMVQRSASNLAELIHAKEQGALEELFTCIDYLDEIAESARNLSHRLSPVGYKNLGIVAAIERLCERISTNSDINIILQIEQLSGYFADDWNIELYRIVQEALNNIQKHANASEIVIEAKVKDGELYFAVTDNGKGIIKPYSPGLGLLVMKQRAAMLNGYLRIEKPENGQGTQIQLQAKRFV